MIWHTDQHVAIGQRWRLREPEYTWCKRGDIGEHLMVPAGELAIVAIEEHRQLSGGTLPVAILASEQLPGWKILFTVRGLLALCERIERQRLHRDRIGALVLSRHEEESVVIDLRPFGLGVVECLIVEINGDKVRTGYLADGRIKIHRREVYDAIHRNNGAKLVNRLEPNAA